MDITGKNAVVIGSGIGRGITLALAWGAAVAIADIMLDNARAEAGEIKALMVALVRQSYDDAEEFDRLRGR